MSFAYGGNGTDPAVRLVDVNADGLVDLLQANGARLNQSEPPDELERIESPFGAVTAIAYAPSTDADFLTPPPVQNPVVDGQRRHGQPLWIVQNISIDAGTAFGQPVVERYFSFVDPVFDVDDRAFRGFGIATVRQNFVGGFRRLDRTWFHTRDGLRGRVAQQDNWEEIGGASARLLTRTFHVWAMSSATRSARSRAATSIPRKTTSRRRELSRSSTRWSAASRSISSIARSRSSRAACREIFRWDRRCSARRSSTTTTISPSAA